MTTRMPQVGETWRLRPLVGAPGLAAMSRYPLSQKTRARVGALAWFLGIAAVCASMALLGTP